MDSRAREFRRTAYAWGLALSLSGLPSSVHALLTGTDVLAATRAAGEMLLPSTAAPLAVFTAAAIVHAIISLFWTVILRRFLPRTGSFLWILGAATLIAVLDLLLIGRFFASIRGLAFWPQLADHVAFAWLALSVPRTPSAPAAP